MRAFAGLLAMILSLACAAKIDAPPPSGGAASPQKTIGPGATTDPVTVDNAPADESGPAIPVGDAGSMCGGIAGFQCIKESHYCAIAEGECVEIADVAGTCRPKPQSCIMEYGPVCGCDGETYGNACAAASQGVSIASKGECVKAE